MKKGNSAESSSACENDYLSDTAKFIIDEYIDHYAFSGIKNHINLYREIDEQSAFAASNLFFLACSLPRERFTLIIQENLGSFDKEGDEDFKKTLNIINIISNDEICDNDPAFIQSKRLMPNITKKAIGSRFRESIQAFLKNEYYSSLDKDFLKSFDLSLDDNHEMIGGSISSPSTSIRSASASLALEKDIDKMEDRERN